MTRKRVRKRGRDEGRTRSDRETMLYTPMYWEMSSQWWWRPTNEESEKSGGKARKEGRVSSSCNAIDPVAVHHVDTILVRSFQIAGVVGVGFCAITSVADPTCVRMHARTHTRGRGVPCEHELRCTRRLHASKASWTNEGRGVRRRGACIISWERAPSEMRCRLREIERLHSRCQYRRNLCSGAIAKACDVSEVESLESVCSKV